MKSQIITKEKIDLDLTDECSSFGVRIGGLACALIGLWGVACLLSALVGSGPAEMIRGYITAVTGI